MPYGLPSHHSHLQGAHISVSECYPHSSEECVGQDRYSMDPVMKNYNLVIKRGLARREEEEDHI